MQMASQNFFAAAGAAPIPGAASAPFDDVTGIVYTKQGDMVRVEVLSGENARVLTLPETDWLRLSDAATAAGIPIRPDINTLHFMELICAGALASVFVVNVLWAILSRLGG